MLEQIPQIYEFGRFRLDPAERLLLRDGQAVPLAPKVFDLLLVLVERHGRLVEKEELMKSVWADSFVEEANLSVKMSALRKALGESPGEVQFIETVPKRGYRFVATVNEGKDKKIARTLQESGDSNVIREGEKASNINEHEAQHASEQNSLATTPEYIEPLRSRNSNNSLSKKQPNLGGAFALAILIIALAVIGYALYTISKRNRPTAFHAMKMTPLITGGKASNATLSPDGKYIAYVIGEAGHQSVWVRQVAAASNVQIIPPADVEYSGLTFSKDGNYIYSVRTEKNSGLGHLYQLPTLGGTSKKLITDVDSRISLSPDGKRLVFIRFSPPEKLSTLVVANADGSAEQRLAARQGSEGFGQYGAGPAWSPDGKIIACTAINHDANGNYLTIVGVRVDNGEQYPITVERWTDVGRRDDSHIAWLHDGSGLLTTITDPASLSAQIWLVTYPGGEARRITNDLNDYHNISLSADSAAMIAVHTVRISSLWVAPNGEAALARQLATDQFNGGTEPAWTPDAKVARTPDGGIVFTSNKSGKQDIWIMDADGGNHKQLTIDAGANFSPTVSPDGRYIVFASNRAGSPNIWRMDMDGGNPKRLTSGSYDNWPRCSPDGKWVFYSGLSFGKPMVSRVPIDGGDSVRLSEKFLGHPAVSPDGRMVACTYLNEQQPESPMKIAVVSSESGEIVKILDRAPNTVSFYGWTADGRAVMYIVTNNGISNIWSQPIDGAPPKQVTDFNSDQIFQFEWSRDGKSLLCSRGVETSDVVLISNFR